MSCFFSDSRGGSGAATTSKMECFVIIVNSWKLLTIITKHSILDVAVALDPPLDSVATLVAYLDCMSFLWIFRGGKTKRIQFIRNKLVFLYVIF